ncbi:ABC transporter permease [Oceaniglobus ichthyenteri]|uniref:ABC transporter permease n=1 Tax=Oceaniglobus ichthyenteri TaxID=2136177 RepID=UPI000D3541C5|nr:ABC transporter permease [Oceaniglobus ichthyenteri]
MFRNSQTARGLTLIAPPALYALLLLAVPLLAIFAFSFWSQDFLTIDYTPTLNNYREALSEPLYTELMMRSVLIAGAVTVATVLLAFPIAYFVSFHVPQSRKSLWIFLITIPFWTSYLIRVFLWKVILGYNGVLNSSLLSIGIIDEPLTFILYNANAVVITLAHAFAPFAILPIFVSLEKIDRSLLEASRDLGENHVMTFLRVTLPLAVPGVVAATLIVFIPTIGDYVTPRLVGGPNGLMIANMIQTQFLKLNNAPMGAALAVIAMAIVTVIALFFIFLNRRWLKGRNS